jgi:hypothetical protein
MHQRAGEASGRRCTEDRGRPSCAGSLAAIERELEESAAEGSDQDERPGIQERTEGRVHTNDREAPGPEYEPDA